MIKKISAFTLVELITAVALIIILSVISVPIYKSNSEKGKQTEGYSLLSNIRAAQYAYYKEYGYFLKATTKETFNTALGVDARVYKYFNSFIGGERDDAKAKYYFQAKAYKTDGSILYLQYNVTRGHKIVEALDSSWSA